MKSVEIEFEVTDDGKIVTYKVPGEVPGEIHADMEVAMKSLEGMLGTVTSRTSLHPGFTREQHSKKSLKLGHGHDHGPHGHSHG